MLNLSQLGTIKNHKNLSKSNARNIQGRVLADRGTDEIMPRGLLETCILCKSRVGNVTIAVCAHAADLVTSHAKTGL